jgi:fructuronate reductase
VALPPHVLRPQYDREKQRVGIVHLGLGAFHRAHQAVYTDDALCAGDRDWAIAGISLRGTTVRDQLIPQDCLYTVNERDDDGDTTRLIGAIQNIVAATEQPAQAIALLASADTRIVSLTITEKGYLRRLDQSLDVNAPQVAADLTGSTTPQSIYGFLAVALGLRRDAGLPGLTLLSCDNLAANGAQLARLLDSFLERRDATLARWFRSECTCPSTMVDRIVPATTPADLEVLGARLGQSDAGAVFTEPFRQWVIEDRFAGPHPRWDLGGVQFVSAVGPYELGKLRMLNAAHSALAYLGLFRGHQFVHEAVADGSVREVIERLMRVEAAASLPTAPGLDPGAYADRLLERFGNRALPHRLAQIAIDGSHKIPQRWLSTLRYHQQHGHLCPALLKSLAAWIAYVRGDRFTVIDPQAPQLARLWQTAGRERIVAALFGPDGHFHRDWIANESEAHKLQQELSSYAGALSGDPNPVSSDLRRK